MFQSLNHLYSGLYKLYLMKHGVCHLKCVYSKVTPEIQVFSIVTRINMVRTLEHVYCKSVFVRSEQGMKLESIFIGNI